MDKKFYVYTLSYPDETPFYVGKGQFSEGGDRINAHEAEARGTKRVTNPHKVRVIQKIWREGGEVLKDKVTFFESEERALFFEQWLIRILRLSGIKLTNLTDGGEGMSGYKFSEEAVKQRGKSISSSRKGQRTGFKVWDGFVAPTGEVYRGIESLHDFCLKQGLTQQHMYEVARGKRPHHKGWVALKD